MCPCWNHTEGITKAAICLLQYILLLKQTGNSNIYLITIKAVCAAFIIQEHIQVRLCSVWGCSRLVLSLPGHDRTVNLSPTDQRGKKISSVNKRWNSLWGRVQYAASCGTSLQDNLPGETRVTAHVLCCSSSKLRLLSIEKLKIWNINLHLIIKLIPLGQNTLWVEDDI